MSRAQGEGSKKNSQEWVANDSDKFGRPIYRKVFGNFNKKPKEKRDEFRKFAADPMADTSFSKRMSEEDKYRFLDTLAKDCEFEFYDDGRVGSVTVPASESSDGQEHEYIMEYANDSDRRKLKPKDIVMAMTDSETGEVLCEFTREEAQSLATVYTLDEISDYTVTVPDEHGNERRMPIDDEKIEYAYKSPDGDFTIVTTTGYRLDFDHYTDDDGIEDIYYCYVTHPDGDVVKIEDPIHPDEMAVFTNEMIAKVDKENKRDIGMAGLVAVQTAAMYSMGRRGKKSATGKAFHKVKNFGKAEKDDFRHKVAGGFIFAPLANWLAKGFAPFGQGSQKNGGKQEKGGKKKK